MTRPSLAHVVAAFALASCAVTAQQAPPASGPRLAQDQGWSAELRELFHHTPQGSRLMPDRWFAALETPEGGGRFADIAYLAQFGLLAPEGPSPLNPGLYPVGFALDVPDAAGERQVGLTCAACHTADVTVNGRVMRIEGAPAHLDLDRFYDALNRATTATMFDPARFARFAGAVLGDAPTAVQIGALKARFAAYQQQLAGDAALRRPALASGFGRVDALAQIVNALAVTDQGEVSNIAPVAAPTSYPPLWLTPELEYVQWSPIASSPIGRNGGEALGVYGVANLGRGPGKPFSSSILLGNLDALEDWVAQLKPPVWDEALMGAIDRPLAAKGEALFAAACAGCHNMAPYRRTDPADNFFGKDFIAIGKVDYRKLGVDPAYTEAMTQRLIRTNAVTAPTVGGAAVTPAAAFFFGAVGGVIGTAMEDAKLSDAQKLAMNGFRFRKGPDGRPTPYAPTSFTDLKASPLAGVWATGPYLHNGSVATVYELLSPEAERRPVFWTGGREIDRARLGFVSDEAPGLFRFDTALAGNRATGHLFPAGGLTPGDRMAVIEYLKTQ